MQSLLGEVKEAGNIILVIDEVHRLVGSGEAEGGANGGDINWSEDGEVLKM